MMKILVSVAKRGAWRLFFTPEIKERLEQLGEVVWNDAEEEYGDSELKEKLKDADVCFTGWGTGKLGKEILESAGKLKLIAHLGGTVTPFATEYMYDRGIKVISGNNVFAESVAEGVIGYILCSLRYMPHLASEVQKGHWKVQYGIYTEGLLDQTVGLVGFGAIAKCLVKLLKPFRARILVYDPFAPEELLLEHGVESASLEDIFGKAKIISIHAPRKPETYHMIGERLLSMVRDGSLLVNTARGDLIDEGALARELREKRFKAVLDVYETEPLPKDSPLLGIDEALLMPHAAVSLDRYKYVTAALIEDIISYFGGKTMKNEISRSHAFNMTR